jgi:PAS domain S-box-containing protein
VSINPDAPARRIQAAEIMLDSLLDELIQLDDSGYVLTWNRGAERLKGYTADEAIGLHVTAFYTEEDVRGGLAERELRIARETGQYETEGWRKRKDGSRFWASVVITAMRDASGEVLGFVKVTRDLSERRAAEELIRRQRDEILELSTPVIQVWDRVLALPIIGTLDSNRASRLTESLLAKIADLSAEIVILDISGVPTIDTQVAQHLLKTVHAARLMGATSILSGVRPETAQAMVHLGIEIGSLRSRSTLRDALQLALQMIAAGNGHTNGYVNGAVKDLVSS